MKITVHSQSIRALWRQLDEKIFAVPEIQREFVWDTRKACNLLDSINRQLPVGSLLVWETTNNNRHLLRHSLHILPHFNELSRKVLFLIDGQQRLSVLHRVRTGGVVLNDRRKEINFDHIYFNLDAKSDARFVHLKRPDPKRHIAVTDILSDQWRRKLKTLPKYQINVIAKCRSNILGYKIPVVLVETADLADIREAFIRINSGGMKISAADRAFTRASSLDLRHLISSLRQQLTFGFSAINVRTVQLAAALIWGQRDPTSKGVEAKITQLEREQTANGKPTPWFNKKWRHISDAVTKAVDYLVSEIGIVDYSLLPSENMLATLSLFFYANNRAQPNRFQKGQLRRWFWATAVGSRYSGSGFNQNIIADVRYFERLGKREEVHFRFKEPIPRAEIRRVQYNSGSVINKAFLCLLCRQKPRYLESGNHILLSDYASRANRKDRHHIFPRALLSRAKYQKGQIDSICNICYVVAEENQSIGRKKPVEYLSEFRHQPHFQRTMRSHLIPAEKGSALWERDVRSAYRRFLKARLNMICRAFEKESGIKGLFSED